MERRIRFFWKLLCYIYMSKRNLFGGQIHAPNNNCAIPIYYTVINGQMLTDGEGLWYWLDADKCWQTQPPTFPELCTSVLISDTSATEFVCVPPQPTPHHLLILCEQPL